MPTPQQQSVSRIALVVIAVVVAGAALYWLRAILTPLALAVFLAIMIDSFVRVLKARASFLPSWSAMPLALTISAVLFGLTAFLIADNAAGFANQLIGYGPKLDGLLARISDAVGVGFPASIDQLLDRLNPTRYVGVIAQQLQSFASNAVFVLIYLGFLIASRAAFDRKAVRLFPERAERHRASETFTRIRNAVEQYLWVQTVGGAMVALGAWAIMAAVGLDNAIFWGFLIFVAGYIPIIGGAVSVLLPPLFALVQFDTYWQAGALFAVLNVINFVVGNLVLPRMQGDSLNIDPVAVLLSLAFWGALWGLPGMFLSTPLTVTAMVILAQFDGSRWLAVLISGDGDPLRGGASGPQGVASDEARHGAG
jgi:predicted PurR-regulated permease PerM